MTSTTNSRGGEKKLNERIARPHKGRQRRRAPNRPQVSIPDLATTIRWIREDLGLTQAQAAAEVNFSAVHLGRFERGESKPPPDTLERIISGYRLDKAMASHLRELAGPAIMLAPPDALRRYVRAEKSLRLNLERFQARAIPAAFIDPFWNLLAHNDLFAAALPGIDDSGSISVWMFSDYSKTVVTDPESEGSWTVAMLKSALGRHRSSAQAKDLVSTLTPISDARRLWAASVNVSHGRDSQCPLHAYDANHRLVSYQLSLTDGMLAHHVQLVTATPEAYSGPELV
ncbi:helix-turn-helix domain-containing protein [Nocardia sp. NPDC058114]|uniref:helix-turn-helix domain-containing protein n=1 Tax=Nocardia sp. NPDC058114 TaxID=3346346 RepID=UPI0036DC0380